MAWAGASEVAKGINSGMEAVKSLDGAPALLFLTDGHESPPVNPGYRPRYDHAGMPMPIDGMPITLRPL